MPVFHIDVAYTRMSSNSSGHLLEVDALHVAYVILFGFLLYRLFLKLSFNRNPPRLRSAAVLVLGDIGRSPRMMYHSESLAKSGFETYVIGNQGERRVFHCVTCSELDLGLLGSRPVPSLLSIPHVHFLYLPTPSNIFHGLPFVLSAPSKVIHQVFSILNALLFRIPQPPEFIIVQVR